CVYTNDAQVPVPGFKVLRQSASARTSIITAGVTLHEALKAYEQLAAKGIAIRVIDLYCVKPIDAVEIDHANGDAFGCELLVGFQGLVQSHASGDDRGAGTRTLAQHLESRNRDLCIIRVDA